MGRAKQRCRIDSGHVKRGQLVGALARRGLLEEQSLVLRLVGADFAGGCASRNHCVGSHNASTCQAARTLAAVSMLARVITSVAHQSVQFFNSGYQRLKSMPPTIFASINR